MRIEIKTIQREVGITTLFVTHDQEEALAMSDVIVVMNHGVVEQMGSPEEVYNFPATRFVASFLGQSNLLDGVVTEAGGGQAAIALDGGPAVVVAAPAAVAAGGRVTVIIRAQKIMVGAAGANTLKARVTATAYLGGTASYLLDCGGLRLQAINPIVGRVYREGEEVALSFAAEDAVLLDKDGKRIG